MIRLATYNIHHGATVDGTPSLERVCDILAEHTVDIACLQELDQRFGGRSGFVDQPAVIADRLGMHVHFVATVLRDNGAAGTGGYGHGVFSRWPITRTTSYPLPGGGEPRALVAADIDTPEGTVTVMSAHVTPGPSRRPVRTVQLRHIAEIASTAEHPVIVAGDLNTANAHELDAISASLADTVDPDRWSPRRLRHATFPSTRPLIRIDRVYVGDGVAVERVRTVRDAASDHTPVIVDLRLTSAT